MEFTEYYSGLGGKHVTVYTLSKEFRGILIRNTPEYIELITFPGCEKCPARNRAFCMAKAQCQPRSKIMIYKSMVVAVSISAL